MGRYLLSKMMQEVAVIHRLPVMSEIGTFVSPSLSMMTLAHISTESDQNLYAEFGIFQYNPRFDVRILTLLPSEPLLEYVLHTWLSFGKWNLEVGKGIEPRQKQPPTTLLIKRLWHRCFSVNFSKFLRTPFSQNTLGRVVLPRVILFQCCLSLIMGIVLLVPL